MLSFGSRFVRPCRHLFTSSVLNDVKVKMPSLSPTMTAGTIVKWLKKEGESVAAGDALCEIQTDKAIVTMETDEEGVLAKILVAEGTADINVGHLIALIAESGEDWKQVQSSAASIAAKGAAAAPSKPAAETKPADQAPSTQPVVSSAEKMGPAVRLLLQLYGLEPKSVPATGRSNTLLKDDVQKFIASRNLKPQIQTEHASTPKETTEQQKVAQPQTSKAVSRRGSAKFTDIPLSGMRKTVAKRLADSKQNSPHTYSTMELELSEVLKARAKLKSEGVVVSVNDFIIKAAALALRLVPGVNVSVDQAGNVKQQTEVDVSVAVAIESGLITPIVKSADSKGLAQIAVDVKELAAKAKANKLQLHEFQGGTFTISNLGMFGITEFTAIINPPQSAILAVGGATQTLDASLNVNNRIAISEESAFQFLASFRGLLESPSILFGNSASQASAEGYL